MQDDRYIVRYLDQLRIDRKIKIQDFTKGIISRRNYSRLLSEDISLSFDILFQLIDRLSLPLYDFSGYVRNSMIYDNLVVFEFVDAVLTDQIELAYNEFYPQIKDKEWDVPLTRKHLPIAMIYLEYKMNKISKTEMMSRVNNIMQLNEMVNSKVLYGDDVILFRLYTEFCNDSAKTLISEFLFDALFSKKITVLTSTVEPTRIMMYEIILKSIITKSQITKKDHAKIEKVLESFIEYHKKAKTELLDFQIFQLAYEYMKKQEIRNDLLMFHYFASFISVGENPLILSQNISIDEQDVERFIKLLSDDEMLESSMYERLCSHDLL